MSKSARLRSPKRWPEDERERHRRSAVAESGGDERKLSSDCGAVESQASSEAPALCCPLPALDPEIRLAQFTEPFSLRSRVPSYSVRKSRLYRPNAADPEEVDPPSQRPSQSHDPTTILASQTTAFDSYPIFGRGGPAEDRSDSWQVLKFRWRCRSSSRLCSTARSASFRSFSCCLTSSSAFFLASSISRFRSASWHRSFSFRFRSSSSNDESRASQFPEYAYLAQRRRFPTTV